MRNIDTIIFDLNGTLYEKGIVIEGVSDTLKRLRSKGFKFNFITNTDGRKIEDVYSKLPKMGLDISIDELFTPVSAAKLFIEQNKDKTFYLLVHDEVKEDLCHANINEKNPDYIIIGDFRDKMSYDEINKVFKMIKGGSQILALSKTLSYIGVDGHNINTGAFVKMFEAACNKEAVLMGKPSLDYFNLALDRTESIPENTLIIGDDITTDILGAKKLNAIGVLVKTGCFCNESLNNSDIKPDYIVENVNQLPKLLNI